MGNKPIHLFMRAVCLTVMTVGLWTIPLKAQFIQQLRVNPVQPIDNLPVQIIADLFFPNSGCPLGGLNVTQTAPNRFEGYAIHCLGLLTTICSTSDTFDLGILTAGNYRFVLREEYGWLPTPCTPGTQPPAIDSIDFQVTVSSGLTEQLQTEVVLSPNPAPDGRFTMQWSGFVPGTVCRILDSRGRFLRSVPVSSSSTQIDISDFAEGLYFIDILQGDDLYHRLKLVKQ